MRRGEVLVGAKPDQPAGGAQGAEHLPHPGIGPGLACRGGHVMRDHRAGQRGQILGGQIAGLGRAPHEGRYAVADEGQGLGCRDRRAARLGEHPVHRGLQVGDAVNQGAVEVEGDGGSGGRAHEITSSCAAQGAKAARRAQGRVATAPRLTRR